MKTIRMTLFISIIFQCLIVHANTGEILLPQSGRVLPHYSGIASPVTDGSAIHSYPIGVGDIANGGDTMNIQIALNEFSEDVDIYFAMTISEFPGLFFFMNAQNELVLMDGALPPVWKKNLSYSFSREVLGEIPASSLLEGTYTFFLLVTPHNSFDRYYLWTTSFDTTKNMDNEYNPFQEGILILNEISPWPSDNQIWIELLNPTLYPVSLDGWRISFRSGDTYTFPVDSGDVEAGLIHLITLPKAIQPDPDGDGCVLTGPGGDTDAVSWGLALPRKERLLSAGAPIMPEKAIYNDDESIFSLDTVCMRIPGIWSLGSRDWINSKHWRLRPFEEASPGSINPLPDSLVRLPENNSRMASRISLSVTGLTYADSIHYQVATDIEFKNLLVDKTAQASALLLEALSPDTYYWRLRTTSPVEGEWSPIWQFTRLPYDIDTLSQVKSASKKADMTLKNDFPSGIPRLISKEVIGCNHIMQQKDTDMVCLDGCPESGDFNWQNPHPGGDHNLSGGHNEIYCARACIAMIATIGGCTLSQDRISYHIFEEAGTSRGISELGHAGDPYKDLGHGTGVWNEDLRMTLEWMYGQVSGTSQIAIHSSEIFDDNDASDMDSIVDFINDGRPVIRIVPGHATLCDGYAVVRDDSGMEERYLHVLDPWHENGIFWISILIAPENHYYIFPPSSGAPMRCDEPEISMDTDGDLLVDFDEINRFETDPNLEDTDEDGLNDMKDMYGYLFDLYGNHSPGERDMDGDGAPKELDPDNDREENDGLNDGCEDVNRDGWYNTDGSESDNFNASDDFTVLSPICFNGHIRLASEITTTSYPVISLQVVEELFISADQPVISKDYIYDSTWELIADPVLIEIPGIGSVRSESSGEAEMLSSITIEVDESGHYRIITDCSPRVVNYTIHTVGPGVSSTKTEDFHLGFADHHYDYVSPTTPPEILAMLQAAGKPNIFEGEVIVTEEGLRLAGSDSLYDPVGGIFGTLERTWEIWIDHQMY